MESENRISLKGGQTYITHCATDAFRVKSGSVLIYIVPLRNAEIGRRSFLYEAAAGEVFPAFRYQDI